MAQVIAEQSFAEGLSDEQLSRMSSKLDACLELRRGCWARSYLSADRKRLLCEFQAPDAESVREAIRNAELEFDRVWSAQVFAVEAYPELLAKLRKLRSDLGE
jgi:hypothetical protein